MKRTATSTVFVRPNLRAFFLSGVLLVVVQHLITNGHSQGQGLWKPLPVDAREMSDHDLQALIQRATETPSTALYMRLSRCFEARGDYKKALFYLRRAEKIAQSEDSFD
jgi:hypothetical protein